MEYNIDSLNKLIFRPEVSYTDSRNDSYNEFLNQNDSDTISNGFQQRSSLSRNVMSSLDILYNHKFLRPGPSFTLDTHVEYTDNRDRGHTLAIGNSSLTGNLTARECLGLRFTHDVVDVGVRGNASYSRTQNNINPDKTSNVLDWSITGDVEVRLPKEWTLTADCSYTARYGYQLSDVNEVLLNARITKSWRNAILTIEGKDLLNNRKNIIQTTGENFVEYQKVNTLTTYIMVSFTYRLNQMGQSL